MGLVGVWTGFLDGVDFVHDNVWVKIKGMGIVFKDLKIIPRNKRKEIACQATRTLNANRLQTKSGLRPNSRI